MYTHTPDVLQTTVANRVLPEERHSVSFPVLGHIAGDYWWLISWGRCTAIRPCSCHIDPVMQCSNSSNDSPSDEVSDAVDGYAVLRKGIQMTTECASLRTNPLFCNQSFQILE